MTTEKIDYIAEAIKDSLGDRCPEPSDGCPTCEAWKQYDGMRDALIAASNNISHYSECNENTRHVAGLIDVALATMEGKHGREQ